MGRGVKILYHNIMTPPPHVQVTFLLIIASLFFSLSQTRLNKCKNDLHLSISIITGTEGGGGGGSIYYGIIF